MIMGGFNDKIQIQLDFPYPMSNSLCKSSDKLNDLILSRTKTAIEVLIFEENTTF